MEWCLLPRKGTPAYLVPRDEANEYVEKPSRWPVLEEPEELRELAPLHLSEDHEDAEHDSVYPNQDTAGCAHDRNMRALDLQQRVIPYTMPRQYWCNRPDIHLNRPKSVNADVTLANPPMLSPAAPSGLGQCFASRMHLWLANRAASASI